MAGPLLIYSSSQRSAVMWDTDNDTQAGVLRWDEGAGDMCHWASNPQGSMAVSTHRRAKTKIWNLETRECKTTITCLGPMRPRSPVRVP